MISFILPFFHRILSGAVNAFGYSKNRIGLVLTTILLLIYPILVSKEHWLYLVFVVINIIVVFMKMISFGKDMLPCLKKYKDIHFWENLVTGCFMIYLTVSGYNLLLLMCSVYPALIIHKGLINLGSKLSFFAQATDDPTGKTYGIPLLGIKIKRSNTQFRLIAAGLSIIGVMLVYLLKIDIHFYLL